MKLSRWPTETFSVRCAVGRGAGHRDAVAARAAPTGRREKSATTSGVQVGGRVVHLVEQLLLDGGGGDRAAGAGHLGDHRGAVVVHLGDREAEPGQAGDVLARRGRRSSRR